MTEREIVVIVDNNKHGFKKEDGSPVVFGTVVDNDIITLRKCQEVWQNIKESAGYEAESLEFCLDVWDVKGDPEMSPNNVKEISDKVAYYYKKENKLVIWKNKTPIYENENGQILREGEELRNKYGMY